MKFMDRLKARHALKAQGATPAEAADQVREMKEAPVVTAPVVAKPAPVAPVVADAPALVTPPVVEPTLVTDGDVVIAGEKEKPVADMTANELDDMTVVELRDFASEFDIEGRSSMDKAELVAALEAL